MLKSRFWLPTPVRRVIALAFAFLAMLAAPAFGGNDADRNARGDQYALGVRYQLPISPTWIVRADAMYGWLENVDNIAGARLELRRKF